MENDCLGCSYWDEEKEECNYPQDNEACIDCIKTLEELLEDQY